MARPGACRLPHQPKVAPAHLLPIRLDPARPPAGPMYCRSGVRAKGSLDGVNVAPPGQLVTEQLDQVALMRTPEVLYAVRALRRPANT